MKTNYEKLLDEYFENIKEMSSLGFDLVYYQKRQPLFVMFNEDKSTIYSTQIILQTRDYYGNELDEAKYEIVHEIASPYYENNKVVSNNFNEVKRLLENMPTLPARNLTVDDLPIVSFDEIEQIEVKPMREFVDEAGYDYHDYLITKRIEDNMGSQPLDMNSETFEYEYRQYVARVKSEKTHEIKLKRFATMPREMLKLSNNFEYEILNDAIEETRKHNL